MRTAFRTIVLSSIVAMGAAVGGWAMVTLVAGLKHVDWQVSELLRQYLIATGIVKPTHTLVDFYSHIKGIEYLICVAFFFVFPIFYKYVNGEAKKVENTMKQRARSERPVL